MSDDPRPLSDGLPQTPDDPPQIPGDPPQMPDGAFLTPASPELLAEESALLAALVADLGGDPRSIRRLHGGAVNVTHRVTTPAGDVVVRFPIDHRRRDDFLIEMWAARAAAAAGIPVALPLRAGELEGVPFMVSEYIDASGGSIDDPWTQLGHYSRRLEAIDLGGAPSALFSRFGRDLAAAWALHVQYNLDSLTPDDPLLVDGGYDVHEVGRLRTMLTGLMSIDTTFGLAHGDLAPRNLLAREGGAAPVLIDWGAATTGPSPLTDAQRVFEWAFCERSIPPVAYDEFATAAGVGGAAARRTVARMVVLHLLDVTRWARERRPDLYTTYIGQCRRGIAGVFAAIA